MKRIILVILSLSALPLLASAQQWSVGTNLLGYANTGTLTLSGSASVARHLTVVAEAGVNPWTFNASDPETQKQNRSQTYSAGIRWWPWYVYSGWWAGVSARYQEYNRGGFRSRETEEGDAFGASLGAGYTLMLRNNLNLEMGAGVWGGYKTYTTYRCPSCGKTVGQGEKWFVVPADMLLSLVFIF